MWPWLDGVSSTTQRSLGADGLLFQLPAAALPLPNLGQLGRWTAVDELKGPGWHAVGRAVAGSHHCLHVQGPQGLGDLGAGVHLAVHAHQEGPV